MKATTRKRAKGGGTKPKGNFSEKREWFSTRITKATREGLESEVRLSLGNRSLSQVAEEMLERGLDAKRALDTANATRGICHLIAQLAGMVTPYKADDRKPEFEWRTNPFMFETFKLGILQLLDNFKPAGEARSPLEDHPDFPRGPACGPFDTPQGQADWAVSILLHNFEKAQRENVQDRFGLDPDSGKPVVSGNTARGIERRLYGMEQAKRDLAIKDKGGKS